MFVMRIKYFQIYMLSAKYGIRYYIELIFLNFKYELIINVLQFDYSFYVIPYVKSANYNSFSIFYKSNLYIITIVKLSYLEILLYLFLYVYLFIIISCFQINIVF